ncbi:transcript variant X1, partial [Nothobranchius furzeri]
RQLCISPTPVPALSSIHGESSERDDNLEEVMEQGETKKEGSSQMLSCVGIEANIDEEEFNNIQNSRIESSDDTWSPNRETEVDSSSEEDETIEMDSGTDDSGDEDYTPYTHIRTGAALQKTLQLETLQEINIEDTVHDCNIPEATDRRLTSKKGLPRRYKLRPEDPRRYGLLSGVPAPSTEELLQHLRTRGDGKTLPQT